MTTDNETLSINPVTKEIFGRSPLHSLDDLQEMVGKARGAQLSWAELPVKQRLQYFYNVQDYLVNHADELAAIIARDTGKLRIDALATEVLAAAVAVKYYCRKAKRFLRDRKPGMGSIAFFNKRSKLIRVPYGVIGVISPWNYPFSIPFSEVLTGLMAGNAVILKTASETQMVGQALKDVFEYAELPEGIFQFINLPGRQAGPGFLQSGIDKLFLTGSVAVGKTIMKLAADTLTPVHLELGGNDAMIVCADANLERAVNGTIWAGFSNAGQSCGGIERIYVQENIYHSFLEKLKSKIETLRVGYDLDFNVDMGALTTEKQMESVRKQIEDALRDGAKIYAQSKVPAKKDEKNFLPAMILTEVNHKMDVMRHETFGPVVGVMKFSTIEEALALANDSYLGLTASVWSANRKQAREIARKLKAGAVTINDHLMSHGMPETSWGGFKQSGIGRSHGELGLLEMTQAQFIVDDWLSNLKMNFWWQPYDEKIYQGLKGFMDFFMGEGILKRIIALKDMMKMALRIFR